jgi:hypothetical protein
MVPVSMLVVLFGLLVLFGTVTAAPATPSPEALPAVACQVAPQTTAGINEIVLTGGGTPTLPMTGDQAVPYVKPDGNPAQPETIDGIAFTVQQFVSCGNEGDILRLLALFSDNYLRTNAEPLGLPITEDETLLTPVPGTRAVVSIVAIDDVIAVDDGDVSALVTLHILEGYKSQDAALHIRFVYGAEVNHWLIDEVTVVIPPEAGSGWTRVQGQRFDGVIVPENQVRELTDFYVSGPIEGTWTPTTENIEALESSLPSYEQTIESTIPGISEDFIYRLPFYKRQYAGFIQGGRNLILVNAMCEVDYLTWLTRPVIVMDGGDCFFRVIYDPAAGTYSDFQINGVA